MIGACIAFSLWFRKVSCVGEAPKVAGPMLALGLGWNRLEPPSRAGGEKANLSR